MFHSKDKAVQVELGNIRYTFGLWIFSHYYYIFIVLIHNRVSASNGMSVDIKENVGLGANVKKMKNTMTDSHKRKTLHKIFYSTMIDICFTLKRKMENMLTLHTLFLEQWKQFIE